MLSRIAGAILMTGAALNAVEVVKDGVPCADIVISDDPGPVILAAARDLQKHIFLMSGAELKIVTAEKSAMPTKICVGESECTREAGYTPPSFRGSGYDIWVKDSRIVLTGPTKLHREPAGNKAPELAVFTASNVPGRTKQSGADPELGLSLADDTGPVYAVSAFLEKLGVRFYAPGEDGTVIPPKKTITIPEGREMREAAFDTREYQGELDAESILWLKRLKNGSSVSSRIGVLALADLMREKEKEHPDWIARDKHGELLISHDQCGFPRYLNEDFRKACAEKIRSLFDADPEMKKLIVMPPGSSCKMDEDEINRIRTPGFYPQFPKREISFEFVSALARELKKTHPDRRIVWMGPENDSLPQSERLAVRPENLTAAPRALAPHRYAKSAERTKYLNELNGLNEAFHPEGMIQREWWNEFSSPLIPSLPFWFPKALQETRKGQHESGVTGFVTDLGGKEIPLVTHLMIYLDSRLMWEPELDTDALISEYCRLWFGPAESEMLCLIHLGADIADRNGIRTVNTSLKSQMRFDDVPVIFQLLDRAREKTRPGTPYRRRVEELAKSFAWLKDKFQEQPAESGDPLLTAQPFPWNKACTGDLSVFKNWLTVCGEGPNRTEMALGVTDNRDRLVVAIRCFDGKMTEQSAVVRLPDDLATIVPFNNLGTNIFGITLRSPDRGDYFLAVNPDGSFIDGSTDPETVIQNGSVLGWSHDLTRVAARRFADRWEAEIHVALGTMGGPWPDRNPPWTLSVQRTIRDGKTQSATSSFQKRYALAFPNVDSEGNDIHARRLLPGATDQYVYCVKKAAGPVPPDAAWDGPEWKKVPELRLGLNWYRYGQSADFCPDARAKLQYDDQYLYVQYLVKDQYVKAEYQNDQDSVCRDSCMEFFTKPVATGPYLNFECNCIGTLLLYRITENPDKSKNMVPLPKEELAPIERFHTLNGPILKEITEPTVWRLSLRIPLDIFVKHGDAQLPLTGQVWGANFYNCADTTSHPRWMMWKRSAAFHTPEDFGKIIFE